MYEKTAILPPKWKSFLIFCSIRHFCDKTFLAPKKIIWKIQLFEPILDDSAENRSFGGSVGKPNQNRTEPSAESPGSAVHYLQS